MRFAAFLAALSIAGCSILIGPSEAPRETRSSLTNFKDRPAVVPLRETVFGLSLDDPYRWMERPNRAQDVSAWIRASSEHTRAQLAALPGRKRLAERLQKISRSGAQYQALALAGKRLFIQRLDANASIAKLIVREPGGAERILFDPANDAAKPAAINNFTPSPSGARIAYHVAEGGGEVGIIRFMNVATGKLLADELKPVWGEFAVSWIDEDTVIYTRMADPPGADQLQGMDVRLHRLGTPTSADAVLLASGGLVQPVEFPSAGHSPISSWTLGYAGGARANFRLLFARTKDVRGARPNWRALADYGDQINSADVRGNDAYLQTTKKMPNGEVIRVDLRHPTLASADTALPASDLVLTSVFATTDGVYVEAMKDGASRLLFLPDGRGPAVNVELPFDGTLANIRTNADATAVTFALSSWLQNERYYVAKRGRIEPLGVEAETYIGVSNFEVKNEEAVSADGTHVPLFILAPKGLAHDRDNPTILYAYGSYGISQQPVYAPNVFAWMEERGVYGFCAVRGGGERGRDWHDAGRERHKPNGHADFIACAERLIELGYTRPARLGATGVSAGGLVVPPAALKRPDLFAAVVPRVSILNPTRLSVAENGPNQYAEMGNPNTPEGFHALYEEDSYHWLARAAASPNWFLTVGLNDHRVEPWMSAKFLARALELFGDKQLVLVRTDPEAGHGIGSTRDQAIEERADIYAFFLNRFGVADFISSASPASR